MSTERTIIDCYYSDHESINFFECVYCGGPASTIDHVPPISFLSRVDDKHRFKPRRFRSCEECNHLLGPYLGNTLRERRKFLRARYEERYRKILSIPNWTESALDEMGPNLYKYIISKQDLRRYLRKRMSNLGVC
jgi:5-methylcytosine-specific restriction endonuclease McrA